MPREEANWQFEEPLSAIEHCRFVVKPQGWSLKAYFPGPDLRHSGMHWEIAGADVAKFLEVVRSAWRRLKELQAIVPTGGDYSETLDFGVRVNRSKFPGTCVTLCSYHAPIRDEAALEAFVGEVERLSSRSLVIAAALAEVQDSK